MIVGVVHTKGGVGKTTMGLNLAIARALQGRDVWLIDCDPIQKSATNALAVRAETNRVPAISVSHFTNGELLRTQITHQKSKYDDIIVECGGGISSLLRAVLNVVDVAVAPFQPRTFDVWAMDELALMVAEARGMRDGLDVYAVLNMADPSGQDNADAAEYVSKVEGIEYLNTPIGRRKAIAEAAGRGMSILEYTPADHKARAEMEKLIQSIFKNK